MTDHLLVKIKNIRIQNFRAFKDELVDFNDYTCLVGPNGAGKSTVLCALNVFFGETGHSPTDLLSLDEEDFFQKNTTHPITITVTFNDLEPDAQADFGAYVRHDELVISIIAVFDSSSKKAPVKQFGQRKVMSKFAQFFEAIKQGEKVADLLVIYNALRVEFPLLPEAKKKDSMEDELRAYEEANEALCELRPSEDHFYGVSKGENRLKKYVQWVFVPAVKDATTEQNETKNSVLGKLLERTVRSKVNFEGNIQALKDKAQDEYKKMLETNQGALDDISSSLKAKLAHWAHPDANLRLKWSQDEIKAIRVDDPFAEIIAGEGSFEGQLSRFGHGLQRSYIFAILQELAGTEGAEGPRLILGVEEPELYQHPPQARHLSDVLKALSIKNTQVVLCTHEPVFISGNGFEDVRMVRKQGPDHAATVSSVTFDELSATIAHVTGTLQLKPAGVLAKINQELQPQINEIFFTQILVLVEGLEDVAYLTAYLHLLNKWDEYRKRGFHIVHTNGKHHMVEILAITQRLKIPTFVLFDSDSDKEDRNGSRGLHERDNAAILKLCGIESPTPFPDETLWAENVVMWKSDIGKVVEEDVGSVKFSQFKNLAEQSCGHAGGLNKNSLYISHLLSEAWDGGERSKSLERLCGLILQFSDAPGVCTEVFNAVTANILQEARPAEPYFTPDLDISEISPAAQTETSV